MERLNLCWLFIALDQLSAIWQTEIAAIANSRAGPAHVIGAYKCISDFLFAESLNKHLQIGTVRCLFKTETAGFTTRIGHFFLNKISLDWIELDNDL